MKALYLAVTGAAIAGLTIYTVAKSPRIAEFLDALTNERLSRRAKAMALLGYLAQEAVTASEGRHCERSEAIHLLSFLLSNGLLRCARNDVDKVPGALALLTAPRRA